MKKKIAVLGATIVSTIVVPVVALAQITPAGTCINPAAGIAAEICVIYGIIKIVIPVLILGAVAYFIWGIVQFITASDAEEKGNARGMMVHGIIGFAVILGLWGIVNVLLNTFGVNNSGGSTLLLPTF